ncbi:DUF2303 family protein [Klenkia sp. LSe6-5]|uniref:DUF2303 family protein n=1 Tax=Klenkia sesuvii TaxID=3103137 RepID=A0ABU8DYI7_9ACTN
MNPYEDTKTDSAVAAELAGRLGAAEHDVETIELADGRSLVRTLRQQGVVETLLDPDDYAARPRYKTGKVELLTVPSLIAYVEKHQGPGTEVWVRPDAGLFEAVLDDHGPLDPDGDEPGRPGWGDHRAVCTLQQTRDWKHWLSLDGKLLDQLQFAEHIEAGLHNVVDPAAADLLEIAQTLHGSRNVDWKSGARLSDGQVQLRYEERIEGKAAGDLEIPQTFTLALAPFEGTEPVRLVASLRWRLGDGRVQLGYRLQRPDVVLREAVDGLIDQLEGDLDLRVLLGTPRPARDLP